MKVTIEKKVTSTVTETVDVEAGYYKGKLLDSSFYYLCPSGTLIHVNSCAIYIFAPERQSYNSYIQEIVNDYTPCDQPEFEAAKDKVLGQLSHVKFPETASAVNPLADSPAQHTMFDPNTAQQEPVNQEATVNDVVPASEQATVTDQESAAQDQAMGVDSEEGSTEG